MKKMFLAIFVAFWGSTSLPASESEVGVICDLVNLRTHRVVQTREAPLSEDSIAWLFGGGRLTGIVRDNPREDGREMEIVMEYREGASFGRSVAWGKYDPRDPQSFERPLAEAQLGLPFPGDAYSLSCRLYSK